MRRVLAVLGLVALLVAGSGAAGAAPARAEKSVTTTWAITLLPAAGGTETGYFARITYNDQQLTGVGGRRGLCAGVLEGTDIGIALNITFIFLGQCQGEVVVMTGTIAHDEHASGTYRGNRGLSGAWVATIISAPSQDHKPGEQTR